MLSHHFTGICLTVRRRTLQREATSRIHCSVQYQQCKQSITFILNQELH